MSILIFSLFACSRFRLILKGSVVPPTPCETWFMVKTTDINPNTTKTVAVGNSYRHMPDTTIKDDLYTQLILEE
jgi:hypothetical protein